MWLVSLQMFAATITAIVWATYFFKISINLPNHRQEHNQGNKEAFSTARRSETQDVHKRIEISLK